MIRSFVFTLIILNAFLSASLFAQKSEAEHPELKKLVSNSGYEGCILIFRQSDQSYHSGNAAWVDKRFIPASTFKIISAQIALETGVIADVQTSIPWDGVTRSRPSINRDLTLAEAFRLSAVPHFQKLVRKVGAARMQGHIDAIPYGNQSIAGGIDQFWLTGELRISPREQIQLLRRLHSETLPFRPEVMKATKDMMRADSDGEPTFHAKTGWAVIDENLNYGWWVGWQDSESELLFFATILVSDEPGETFGSDRISLTKAALKLFKP